MPGDACPPGLYIRPVKRDLLPWMDHRRECMAALLVSIRNERTFPPPLRRLASPFRYQKRPVPTEKCLSLSLACWYQYSGLFWLPIHLARFRIQKVGTLPAHREHAGSNIRSENLIRTRVQDKLSGSMKITTHLERTSHCETASGTNGSNK